MKAEVVPASYWTPEREKQLEEDLKWLANLEARLAEFDEKMKKSRQGENDPHRLMF